MTTQQVGELVARAQQGDSQAFAELYEPYSPVVSVELRFFAGLSVAETAARMGRSDEAVKKLPARALANPRRALVPSQTAGTERRVAAA